MLKRTPSPWSHSPSSTTITSGNRVIAQASPQSEETAGNIAVLTVAPELLEMVALLREALVRVDPDFSNHDLHKAAVRLIAKATGQDA